MKATCWCERSEVVFTADEVRDGITHSCGRSDCGDGQNVEATRKLIVRVPLSIYDEVQTRAKAADRSVASYIRSVLSAALLP